MVDSCSMGLIKFSGNTVPNLYHACKLCHTRKLSSCSSDGLSNMDDIVLHGI